MCRQSERACTVLFERRDRIARMRIFRPSGSQLAEQCPATAVIARTRVALPVESRHGLHQWPIDVLRESVEELGPVGGEEVLHFVSAASVVFFEKDRLVSSVRFGQVHDHRAMVQRPKRAARIVAVDGEDAVAGIQTGVCRHRGTDVRLRGEKSEQCVRRTRVRTMETGRF